MNDHYTDPATCKHTQECADVGFTPQGVAILTLRDQFAMAALTGLLMRGGHDHDKRDGRRYYELAYKIADGMLDARKR